VGSNKVDINLRAGETVQSAEPARLFDVQRRRGTSGEWLGANVRIVKGLSLRLGKFDSQQTRLPVETVPVDSGQLYRTSQRIVFFGATNLVEIETRNIISTDQSDGRLTVYVHGRANPYIFVPQVNAAALAPRIDPGPRRDYHLPPRALLGDIAPLGGDSTMDHRRNAAIIVARLASFNIPARVAVWNAGPVVTQYEVEPSPEINLSRIEALADDLAMALGAPTIRIEAPIPGKSVVGLEIPNKDPNIVQLGRIFDEVDLRVASKLTFALGRDVAGHARATDLARMPHLLIAGAAGSGKSVMVRVLITSLLCTATPDEVRMILIDTKTNKLSVFNGVPHLVVPVLEWPEMAKAALNWAVAEMESRTRSFAGGSAPNIAAFNQSRADPAERLPFVVIIIDELADLMMREGKNVEEPIVSLAQKARPTGIHIVLATRPSVEAVTDLIRANFPSRIAFAMESEIDSRRILDMPGAEDLIGRGDMLFQPADVPRPIRLQGVFVSDKEIANICEHWRSEGEPRYVMGVVNPADDPVSSDVALDEEADRLLLDAAAVIKEYDRASASLLQRRLKIGYARAARIMDQLEARGYIGPFDGSNARQVLRR
jgi:S-DNA-T family DNA segregation ATPase FtsK/SpoIIIE